MLEKKMRIVRIAMWLQTISVIVLIRDVSITLDQWVTVILLDPQVKMVELHQHQQQVITNSTWLALAVDYTSLEPDILDKVTTSELKMTIWTLTKGQKLTMEGNYRHKKDSIKNLEWFLRWAQGKLIILKGERQVVDTHQIFLSIKDLSLQMQHLHIPL